VDIAAAPPLPLAAASTGKKNTRGRIAAPQLLPAASSTAQKISRGDIAAPPLPLAAAIKSIRRDPDITTSK
jgi:hypothetical protein